MSDFPAAGEAALSRSAVRRVAAPPQRGRLAKLRGWVLPLALLVLWELVVYAEWISARLMPPPTTLWHTFGELAEGGRLAGHILVSCARVAVGFAIGASLAMLIGAAVGLSRRLEEIVDSTFQALRAIPSLAWVPLLLLWLGIDEAPKITLIAIGAFFPIYLAVVSGMRNVDRKLIEVGLISGLQGAQLVRRIFIPASLPSVLTGLRTGLSLSWMFLVAAELIAATKGIGYLLTDGRETGRADIVLVAIITLAVLGKLSDSVLKLVEQRLLAWRDEYVAAEKV
jgi:sulfonate transport system permease protein